MQQQNEKNAQNKEKLLNDDVMRISSWIPEKMRMLKFVGRAKNRKR